jgi:hypothetical protein
LICASWREHVLNCCGRATPIETIQYIAINEFWRSTDFWTCDELWIGKDMSEVIQFRRQGDSHEMIIKLINAGYLPASQRDDVGAVATAIIQMKQHLRGRGGDDGPEAA